jgi:maltose-binding protein MalE
MKNFGLRMFAAVMTFVAAVWTAAAQDGPKPAYLDSSLPAEQRAADLVHWMTLKEKASQLLNQARAFPASMCQPNQRYVDGETIAAVIRAASPRPSR